MPPFYAGRPPGQIRIPSRPAIRRFLGFIPGRVSRSNGAVLQPTREEIQSFVRQALAEDIGAGDVTTAAVVPPGARSRADLVAREPVTTAGVALALEAFRALADEVTFTDVQTDGSRLGAGARILSVAGPSRALLTAERVALNCLQRPSGVATLTRAFVDAVAGTPARILDTRKTTPGWRRWEKYAVACGGGTNHRQGLDDLILVKDNHLAALRDAQPNPVAAAVARAREAFPYLKIEVEADTLEQVAQAVAARADIVLLDNMTLAQLREAVALCHGRCLTEASGGVRLDTVRDIAETGVDFISAGALTHSARAVDLGLDFAP